MPLGASLVSFSPGTAISSSQVNSNFSGLNGTTAITGATFSGSSLTITGTTSLDNGNITSNGSGTWNTKKTAFTTGSITRISSFGPVSVGFSANFINHNLGAVPDVILMTTSDLHTTLLIATYEASSMTSSQVKVQANSSVNVIGLAIKF